MTVGSKKFGPRSGRGVAAAENFRAARDGVFDQGAHALDVLRTNQRADVGGGIAARTEAQLFGFFDAEGGEFFADGLLDEDSFDGEADLAAIGVAAPDGAAGGDVEIGVGENDHGVFAAEFEDGGNQVLGAGFGDTASGLDAAGEQNFVGSRVDERLTDSASALNDRYQILRENRRSAKSLSISAPQCGVKSLVLQTTAFPATIAGMIWLMGIASG